MNKVHFIIEPGRLGLAHSNFRGNTFLFNYLDLLNTFQSYQRTCKLANYLLRSLDLMSTIAFVRRNLPNFKILPLFYELITIRVGIYFLRFVQAQFYVIY